ncbi:hypothetical protein [Treponema endosymbiont of Eucomonympha sp.]|uniref:hypothetical protein n=1 Tax=Treponema endosymbiont of Eucomonympha sp. TaxID=1580831 RepID=UPI0007835E95|nr:hypothetical protein [Treponema endosymbiont of Eucomonympha sp.]
MSLTKRVWAAACAVLLMAALAGCGSFVTGERTAENQAAGINQPEARGALIPDQTWRIRLNPNGFHLKTEQRGHYASIEGVAFMTNAGWTSSSGRRMPSYRFRFYRDGLLLNSDFIGEALRQIRKLAEDSSVGIDFCDFSRGGTIPPTTLVLYTIDKEPVGYDELDISSEFFLVERLGGHDF